MPAQCCDRPTADLSAAQDYRELLRQRPLRDSDAEYRLGDSLFLLARIAE
jgi:hypothetical protein